MLGELKDIGVRLALDDFGTGYSSLGYLETLPIDTIKIDQTFIAKLSGDPGRQTIVRSIIQLAHGLGMTVVAEGVETVEQHETLTKLGADACQGFYFARPMSALAINTLVARGQAIFPRPPGEASLPRAPGEASLPRAPGEASFPRAQ